MTTARHAATGAVPTVPVAPRRRLDRRRAVLHVFLITISIIWLFPLLWAVYTSLRPLSDTTQNGYLSLPSTLNFDNYVNAWNNAELARYFLNTLIIVVPAVIIVIIIQPLFRMFLNLPLPGPLSDNGVFYDQYAGIIVIHIAFQLGFCTFVLSNYMKTLPKELNEAALVDGASVWTTFSRVIMPLAKPALAALATLEVTFIYNDFFWALMLMTTGSKLPITTSLNNLKGQFFVDSNLIAAGAMLVALPTLIVYFVLQKQFISGLTLGSTKG
jgi:multiple sugar transport system permease protein